MEKGDVTLYYTNILCYGVRGNFCLFVFFCYKFQSKEPEKDFFL